MSKRGKKQGSDPEEESFESFVRGKLEDLCSDIEELRKGQTKPLTDVEKLQVKADKNSTTLDDLKTKFDSLEQKYEVLNGEVYNAQKRVDELTASIQSHATKMEALYERVLGLERYSRGYNLRFHNVPESSQEDCLKKIKDKLAAQLGWEPELENAHREGNIRADRKPRPILCKFLYRPERFQVIRNRRDLSGIWVTEDLIYEDRLRKKQVKDVMKSAYEAGKKPRFRQGKLYIDGVLHEG